MAFKRFILGFYYAAKGILKAVSQERNLRFHLIAAFYVFFFAINFYYFSEVEYILLILTVCLVISLELLNSAIERIVNKISPKKDNLAGDIKDIAAGAVLVSSVGAAACGVFLFWDMQIINAIFAYFTQNIPELIGFLISVILSGIFIFRK